jgi:hypothetical protein
MGFGKKNYKLQRIETLEKELSELRVQFKEGMRKMKGKIIHYDDEIHDKLALVSRTITQRVVDCELEIDGIHAELEEIQEKGFGSKTGVATKTKNDQKPHATTKYLRDQTNAVPVPMTTTSVQQEKAGDLAAWWGGESKVDKKLDRLAGMIQGIGHRTAEQLQKMDHDMRLITRRLDQIEENENPTQSQRVEPSNPLYKQPPP